MQFHGNAGTGSANVGGTSGRVEAAHLTMLGSVAFERGPFCTCLGTWLATAAVRSATPRSLLRPASGTSQCQGYRTGLSRRSVGVSFRSRPVPNAPLHYQCTTSALPVGTNAYLNSSAAVVGRRMESFRTNMGFLHLSPSLFFHSRTSHFLLLLLLLWASLCWARQGCSPRSSCTRTWRKLGSSGCRR
jgi:hypothetical protein